MVSSSPSINHGPPFDITESLSENDGSPLTALVEARIPKTVIWVSIQRWVENKQLRETFREIERVRQEYERAGQEKERNRQERARAGQLEDSETRREDEILRTLEFRAAQVRHSIWALKNQLLEQETQRLNMILLWIRSGGKKALTQAVFDLEKRCVKPRATDIMQYIEQLLELMKKEYLHTQLEPQTSSNVVHGPDLSESASLREGASRVFKDIRVVLREEIPELIELEMEGNIELRHFILEGRLSNALDKILRLSSWTTSSAHNRRLRELLRNALLTLNDLGGNEEYHHCLRDFMKRHTALCAFTLENANAITAEDSETTAELCKNLRRLAQNLGKIASTKAEQYQKLYENFIANKEDLSNWLDSASPGQGRSLVDGFTDSLKDMASSMRREANFWNSQSNQYHIWPNIKETYGCDINAMPLFPSEQHEVNDHRKSTIPSIHGSVQVIQNAKPEPQRVPQAAQRVSATFASLQKLRVNTTQAFLVKTENSISKRMRETRGYLELVVDETEKQLSEPAEGYMPKVIVRLAEKALCIAKRWNNLQRRLKYWGSILSVLSKPLACQTFDIVSGISRDDFLGRVIATPDMLIHPYVIELELHLRDMWHHFLSRTHFWAGIDSDPATFASWRLAVMNKI